MKLPINNICHSTVNGPGNRLVIWVQGCHLNCKGCFNPETHAYSQDICVPIENIAKEINSDTSIEGITISGGEPLEYTKELTYLFSLTNPTLTKIIFSGYTVDEIFADTDKINLMKHTDFVLAGRFNNYLKHPFYGKKAIDITGRVNPNYFLPRTLIEYSVNKNQVIKTGIFQ